MHLNHWVRETQMLIENHLVATGKVIEPKPTAPPVRPKGGPRGREESIYEQLVSALSKAKAA